MIEIDLFLNALRAANIAAPYPLALIMPKADYERFVPEDFHDCDGVLYNDSDYVCTLLKEKDETNIH